MKINDARITMQIDFDGTVIKIIDSDSSTTLAHVKLTPDQLSSVLSRQGNVECECTTGDLSRIGKTMEHKWFEFEITYSKSKEDLALACTEALFREEMHEWISDNYYESQNTFFDKDGGKYARTIIRRWV